ncbi:hypothetical protein MC885_001146 [Smutsia gigantea]|nr:hypothetical protein MC885_001146 [Smutsia gigantea]
MPATPHSTVYVVCINASPSRVLLPWLPTESAHDARYFTCHCVCSSTTCHQRSLCCNSYRQSGLAIYFACSDLDNCSMSRDLSALLFTLR